MKNKIRYIYLWVINKILYVLQKLNIIPKIWYKSELELAKMKAEKIAEFFEKALERNKESMSTAIDKLP